MVHTWAVLRQREERCFLAVARTNPGALVSGVGSSGSGSPCSPHSAPAVSLASARLMQTLLCHHGGVGTVTRTTTAAPYPLELRTTASRPVAPVRHRGEVITSSTSTQVPLASMNGNASSWSCDTCTRSTESRPTVLLVAR